MDLSVFINFNGLLSTYDKEDSLIDVLTGDIRLLHTILELSAERDKARVILGDKIDKVEYWFQPKEGDSFANIAVKKGQIKQLSRYIIPSSDDILDEANRILEQRELNKNRQDE